MYGAEDASIFQVQIKVICKDDCLMDESKYFSSNGSSNPVKITFSKGVMIQQNKWYDITTVITGRSTLYGNNGKKDVQSTGANSFNVTFFASPLDQNGGGTEMGQIPILYFKGPLASI